MEGLWFVYHACIPTNNKKTHTRLTAGQTPAMFYGKARAFSLVAKVEATES